MFFYSIRHWRTFTISELIGYYKKIYKEKYESKVYSYHIKHNALKGLASLGTADSIKVLEELKGKNEILLQYRDNLECLKLLLSRANAIKDKSKARNLIKQSLLDSELIISKDKKIKLPDFKFNKSKMKDFKAIVNKFIKENHRSVLTKDDIIEIKKNFIDAARLYVKIGNNWEQFLFIHNLKRKSPLNYYIKRAYKLRLAGFEPTTPGLGNLCSIQLSYKRNFCDILCKSLIILKLKNWKNLS